MTYKELVADGAALLDMVGPDDWRDRVNLDRLDMADTYNCVAGQVFGNWYSVPHSVRYHDAFGNFNLDGPTLPFTLLKKAWVAYLTV